MIKSVFFAAVTAIASLAATQVHAGGVAWSVEVNTPVVGSVVSGYSGGYGRVIQAPAPAYVVPAYPQPVYVQPGFAPAPPVVVVPPRVVRVPPPAAYYPAPVVYDRYDRYDRYDHRHWHHRDNDDGRWHRR